MSDFAFHRGFRVAEVDSVVEIEIVRPDELRAIEIGCQVVAVGTDTLGCIDLGLRPRHELSSKSTAYQLSGIRVYSTFGCSTSRFNGPLKKTVPFHLAFVTVPSDNLRMKPASPMWLPYSNPVFGSALSFAMMGW